MFSITIKRQHKEKYDPESLAYETQPTHSKIELMNRLFTHKRNERMSNRQLLSRVKENRRTNYI